MKIIFGNYQVKSSNSGWILQKKRGNQWKQIGYFSSLESLVNSLLHRTFNERTGNLVYYISEEDDAVYMLEALSIQLKSLRDEIIGVLRG